MAARCSLTVLNWEHLTEDVIIATTVGAVLTAPSRLFRRMPSMTLADLLGATPGDHPRTNAPVVVENDGYVFHQLQANWLSIDPGIAARIGWRPDRRSVGRWLTADSELAVETIWWVDGWPAHSGPYFDDTQAEGHVVIITADGLRSLTAELGPLTRHAVLTRTGRENGAWSDPVPVTRSHPLRG